MAWSLEQGLVSRSTNDWIDTRYRAYRAGNVSEVAICGEMVQMYAGLRDEELRAAAARYVNEFVRERVFAEMAALVARCSKAGIEIVGRELDQPLGGRRRFARFRDSGGARSGGRGARRQTASSPARSLTCPRTRPRRGAQARGIARSRCGLRQLDSRPGHAGDGALPVPGESVAGAAGGGGEERLGLLQAAGCRGH